MRRGRSQINRAHSALWVFGVWVSGATWHNRCVSDGVRRTECYNRSTLRKSPLKRETPAPRLECSLAAACLWCGLGPLMLSKAHAHLGARGPVCGLLAQWAWSPRGLIRPLRKPARLYRFPSAPASRVLPFLSKHPCMLHPDQTCGTIMYEARSKHSANLRLFFICCRVLRVEGHSVKPLHA